MAKNEKKKLESAYDEAHEQDKAEAAPEASKPSLAPESKSPEADAPVESPAAPVATATDDDAVQDESPKARRARLGSGGFNKG